MTLESAINPNAKTIQTESRSDFSLFARLLDGDKSIILVFSISGRTLGVKRDQSPLTNRLIRQAKARGLRCSSLGQPPITHHSEAQPVLNYAEWEGDFGADACLNTLDLIFHVPDLDIQQGTPFTGPHRHMSNCGNTLFFPFLISLITHLGENKFPFAIQQSMTLNHTFYVYRGSNDFVGQARTTVHIVMHLHPEMLLVTLLGLAHLSVTLTTSVLNPGWRRDEGRVHHRSPSLHQTIVGRIAVIEAGEGSLAQPVGLLQVKENEQYRRGGSGFSPRAHTNVTSNRITAKDGIFRALVGQSPKLPGDEHVQVSLQTYRCTVSNFALNREWPDLRKGVSGITALISSRQQSRSLTFGSAAYSSKEKHRGMDLVRTTINTRVLVNHATDGQHFNQYIPNHFYNIDKNSNKSATRHIQ